MIQKYQKYGGDTKFHKLFDPKKNFGARELRIFYHLCQKTMIFEFSQRCEIRRAKNFFEIVKFTKKSGCNFFCLVITQKANFLEQFEV